MPSLFGQRAIIINDFQSRKIINIDIGRFSLFLTELLEYASKELSKFRGSNSSDKFGLSRTSSSQCLGLRSINDSTITISKNNTGSRSLSSYIISKGSISEDLKYWSIYVNRANIFCVGKFRIRN